MNNLKSILILGGVLLTSLTNVAIGDNAQSSTEVRHCEYIGDKLHLYSDDAQVYRLLEREARIKAVRKLYAEPLKSFSSAIYSTNTVVNKLISTILIEDSYRINDGLFTPCVILKNPSITDLDLERFRKTRIARVCNLGMNQIDGLENALRHRFTERLKKFSDNNDAVIEYMINDHKKIKRKSSHSLYQLIHKMSDIKPSYDSADDVKCHELYVYPIELYVASS